MKRRSSFTVATVYLSEVINQYLNKLGVTSTHSLMQWCLIRLESVVYISY